MKEQQLQTDSKVLTDLNIKNIEEIEIDLIAFVRKIITIRKMLYKAAVIGLVIGIIIALSIPNQYTVMVTLSPEMGNAKGNNGLAGLAASFLGNGATVGESSDALNASLSADIVSSTPFLLELFDVEIPVFRMNRKLTLKSYLDEQSLPWWNYIIAFPNIFINGIRSLFVKDEIDTGISHYNTIKLTNEENNKLHFLKKNIIAVVDRKTAITSISVSMQDPIVAADVADIVVQKLQEYIVNYRTSKSKDDCAYLDRLYHERQQEYYIAQKKYAEYVDAHDNLILHSVRAEQERLQNDMNLAYQVYSQVANQLQVARAKVQEEKPVFAVVEPSVVPLKPSSTGMGIYMLICAFLSVFATLVWLLFGAKVISSLKKKL